MEPSNFDRAIRDALDSRLVVPEQGGKERVWNRVEQQLHREPERKGWKLAALILLLLIPSAGLWMQNRKQASTIARLSQNLAQLSRQPVVVHDTIIRQHPAIVYTKTDTITQIHIVKDTVVIYRQAEMAVTPEREDVILSGNMPSQAVNREIEQESQRAEFLLNPEEMNPVKSKPERSFTFRFSLGGQPGSSVSPVGIQTRL
jgi:hypothetical protein